MTLDTSVHNNCEGDVEANSSSDSSIEMDVVSHTFAQDEISTIDETALIFLADSSQVSVRVQQPDVSTIMESSIINLPTFKTD